MKASLYHIQINVSNSKKSISFYKDFFEYLEFEIIDEGEGYLGVSNGINEFWIMETERGFKKPSFHRKRAGLNHMAFGVKRKADVDRFAKEFLKPRKIKPLYDS